MRRSDVAAFGAEGSGRCSDAGTVVARPRDFACNAPTTQNEVTHDRAQRRRKRKSQPSFVVERNAQPVAVADRAKLLADPGFGRVFTDHMAIIRYTEGKGWHDAKITRAQAAVARSGVGRAALRAGDLRGPQGLSARRRRHGDVPPRRQRAPLPRSRPSGSPCRSCRRRLFIESIRQLVRIDRDWFPTVEGGSLYIRPFMFANEVFLGVKPSSEYLYLVIISPVGGYFKSGAPAVSLWVSQNYTRAAPGGTGAAKCGGNYASSLVAQAEASKHGCDQVVFLDAAEHSWVEELGGMNVFFVFDDGSLQTPPLSGTILPGITRDSLMTLARAEGLTVREAALLDRPVARRRRRAAS